MVLQTNPPLKEANKMLSTRIRTIIVALVASAGFAGATVAPAVSQAQWHTICYAGHCTTHQNYTIGGQSPCVAIKSSYDKAYDGLLEAIENKKQQADKVHPEMTQAEAQARIEEDEALVEAASLSNFEWGCDIAMRTPPGHVVLVPVAKIKAASSASAVK
jgi:hypothetical protein